MADVRLDPPGGADRAQMILVAAFGVAVMLVALVLILNTSIYTENIATRGSDISGGKEAIQYRATTEQTFVGTIRYVNVNNNTTSSSYTELTDPATHAVWNYSNMTGRHSAKESMVVNVSSKRQSEGTHVFQRNDWNFSNESDVGNWTVASDANGVRDFSMNVTRSELDGGSPGSVNALDPIFYVNFSSGGEWFRIFVYNNSDVLGGTREVVVQVDDDDGNSIECTRAYGSYGGEDRAVINVTNASIEGEHCEALDNWFPLLGAPFDMHYNNTCQTDLLECDDTLSDPYNIKGEYSFIVNKSIDDTNVVAGTSSQDPNATTALYSMTVHTIYESKRLYYETDVRVAPGEPDA